MTVNVTPLFYGWLLGLVICLCCLPKLRLTKGRMELEVAIIYSFAWPVVLTIVVLSMLRPSK